jgi:hypothetical protein
MLIKSTVHPISHSIAFIRLFGGLSSEMKLKAMILRMDFLKSAGTMMSWMMFEQSQVNDQAKPFFCSIFLST